MLFEPTSLSPYIDSARRTFLIESNALNVVALRIEENFDKAIDTILNSAGKIIVSGMGKSGHIGRKIAATFASTGTPSFFLHPAEAFHGDLGMVGPEDIVILLSYSGETDEILKIIPFLQSQENTIIAITGNPESSLAKNARYHLNVHVKEEACPLSLAPTASTTATLVMGDALAIALMEARGFQQEDFARFHPGGSLGRRLLAKVKDFTRYDNLPILPIHADARDLIAKLAEGRLGLVLIKDETRTGIITDGDLRRYLSGINMISEIQVSQLVNFTPIAVDENTPIYQAERLMLEKRITTLLVMRQDKVVGVFQLFNLK